MQSALRCAHLVVASAKEHAYATSHRDVVCVIFLSRAKTGLLHYFVPVGFVYSPARGP